LSLGWKYKTCFDDGLHRQDTAATVFSILYRGGNAFNGETIENCSMFAQYLLKQDMNAFGTTLDSYT